MPGTPETVLAFDFGLRRIGVAVGQAITGTASPLTVVANAADGPDWSRIDALIAEWRPDCLIVGLPLNADGTASELTAAAEAFAADLARFDRPIEMVDERYSSIEAAERLKERRALGLSGRIEKGMIDSAAAVLIAERWFCK